jgi:hypothetical protein
MDEVISKLQELGLERDEVDAVLEKILEANLSMYPGEQIVQIQDHDGTLYGLTNTGRVYRRASTSLSNHVWVLEPMRLTNVEPEIDLPF